MSTAQVGTGTIEQALRESMEKKKPETRSYVVLRQGEQTSPSSSKTFEFVRTEQAGSAEQAVRKTAEILVAASENNSFSGVLVAVPARNFVPVPVTVEVKTQLKLG